MKIDLTWNSEVAYRPKAGRGITVTIPETIAGLISAAVPFSFLKRRKWFYQGALGWCRNTSLCLNSHEVSKVRPSVNLRNVWQPSWNNKAQNDRCGESTGNGVQEARGNASWRLIKWRTNGTPRHNSSTFQIRCFLQIFYLVFSEMKTLKTLPLPNDSWSAPSVAVSDETL